MNQIERFSSIINQGHYKMFASSNENVLIPFSALKDTVMSFPEFKEMMDAKGNCELMKYNSRMWLVNNLKRVY